MSQAYVFSLYDSLPSALIDEDFETLLERPGVRIERILSQGQATPEGVWYDQSADEWVVLLKGAARIQIEDVPESLELTPGDGLFLPAHCRHRVAWTDPDQPSVWLAVHLGDTQTSKV